MLNDTSSSYLKYSFDNWEVDLEKIFNDQIKKFQQLEQISGEIKEKLQEQLKGYQNLQVSLKKEREQVLEVQILQQQKCQFTIFGQLIHQLKELDQQYKSDQYPQIVTKLSSIIDEMLKDNGILITKSINELKQNHQKLKIKQMLSDICSLIKPNFEQYQSQIKQCFSQYDEFIEQLNQSFQGSTSIFTPLYESTVLERIEKMAKKKIKQKELIYLGSRDGLNYNSFWSQANGKSNLLMIFKSKNNNHVFGGYSPCQWKQNLNAYVQDDTLSSFIFSQTKNEFYPLKVKQHAIFCYPTYGPLFGQNDFYIAGDFTTGYSDLGKAYQWDQYQNKQSDHLFGGTQPNIEECEIYELSFE